MKKHDGNIKGFFWSNKSWYKDIFTEKYITFGFYSPEGGSSGEMSMTWENLGGKEVPCLHCFDDAWSELYLFSDLIKNLSEHDDENITQQQFVNILLSCGFKDLTHYEKPDGDIS